MKKIMKSIRLFPALLLTRKVRNMTRTNNIEKTKTGENMNLFFTIGGLKSSKAEGESSRGIFSPFLTTTDDDKPAIRSSGRNILALRSAFFSAGDPIRRSIPNCNQGY